MDMEENVMLRIAVQAKGRLNEQSMDLLKEAGVTVSQEKRKFLMRAADFPAEIIFLRDDDIPEKLREQIEESKEKVFKITYKEDENIHFETFSKEIKYNSVDFSNKITPKVEKNIEITIDKSGEINTLLITTYTCLNEKLITSF